MATAPGQTLNRKRLIPAAILAILVYGMIAPVLGTLLPQLSKQFGMTPDQNGTLASIRAIGLVIASLAIGPIIDLKGKKTGLVGGLVLITLSLFLLPNATGFSPLALYFLLLNLGGGMIVTGANALASDVGEKSRGSVLNLLNLFFGLGGIITPLIGAYLFPNNTIGLCYLLAVFCAATLVLHFLTPMPAPVGETSFKLSDAGRLVTSPKLILLSLILFLYVACEVGVWDWLTSLLTSRGISPTTALEVLSYGFAFGLLVGRIIASRILIKIPAITVTMIASALMAVMTFAMVQTSSVAAAWVFVFCSGLAMAPMFPTTLAMVGDAFPTGTATAMGIAITSGWIGLVLSSKLIGAIAGSDPAGLSRGLLVLPVASVVMVVVSLMLRPLLGKRV
jgi:fucose permease